MSTPPPTDPKESRIRATQGALERILTLARVLREPGGCPWDRDQTVESLTPYLQEETFEVVHKHRQAMPVTIRVLLRGIGDKRNTAGGERSRLLSFLLFEQKFTQELIELGYQDAMRVKDELLQFITGKEVPRLIAPDRVMDDLSGFDS